MGHTEVLTIKKGTSRQRGKGAIRKRFPLQKPRWEKTKLTIRYLYHETYRQSLVSDPLDLATRSQRE